MIREDYIVGVDPKQLEELFAQLAAHESSLAQRVIARTMIGIGGGFLLMFIVAMFVKALS